jgi:hypothetical protein
MEKRVALIVKDDVTELNKRLTSGYNVNNTLNMANGDHLFILVKYERDRQVYREAEVPSIAGVLTTASTRLF